jgi:phage gp36-like protein
MYITPEEYVAYFGLEETAAIATPQRSSQISTDLLYLTITGGDRSAYTPEEIAIADETLEVINISIDSASREMDSYFASRYNLPLSTDIIAKNPIKDFCYDITRYRIAKVIPSEEIVERYKHAIEWLKGVSNGVISLVQDENDDTTKKSSGVVAKRETNYQFLYWNF